MTEYNNNTTSFTVHFAYNHLRKFITIAAGDWEAVKAQLECSYSLDKVHITAVEVKQ